MIEHRQYVRHEGATLVLQAKHSKAPLRAVWIPGGADTPDREDPRWKGLPYSLQDAGSWDGAFARALVA